MLFNCLSSMKNPHLTLIRPFKHTKIVNKACFPHTQILNVVDIVKTCHIIHIWPIAVAFHYHNIQNKCKCCQILSFSLPLSLCPFLFLFVCSFHFVLSHSEMNLTIETSKICLSECNCCCWLYCNMLNALCSIVTVACTNKVANTENEIRQTQA